MSEEERGPGMETGQLPPRRRPAPPPGSRRHRSFSSAHSSCPPGSQPSPLILTNPAGLPNAVSWWGWIAGPLLIVIFYVVSLWTSQMLASVYR